MIRIELENREKKIISDRGKLSTQTKGRLNSEEECEYLTCYQLDRERILYSKAFRRLKHKTQVFLSPQGDHYRTRLMHTIEVSQIARSIARSLELNEDLAEAIALGHDLGHTPFGHAGEVVLNELCPQGFKHNEQSLRVVDLLEGKNGLNLTWEVRDGIKNHTGDELPKTLEGQIVRYADRIAYINHDIDDAKRGKIICDNDLPMDCIRILGNNTHDRIKNMILDIVKTSKDCETIKMTGDFQKALDDLRSYMFEKVYFKSLAKDEEFKAKNIVKELYIYFLENWDLIPMDIIKKEKDNEYYMGVCDYIAGMTDRYAINKFYDIFIPKSWI